jgi:hypothetical protein
MLITGIFSFLVPLLCFIKDCILDKDSQLCIDLQKYNYLQKYKESLNILFMFLYLLPPYILQVLYERIGISAENEEEKTA